MKFNYKQVKEFKPFCPTCGEKLSGDGSGYFPYKCICGEWEWVDINNYKTCYVAGLKQFFFN
jgi:tRNA(Ile2) C34 agmatinyltransferase TiaS